MIAQLFYDHMTEHSRTPVLQQAAAVTKRVLREHFVMSHPLFTVFQTQIPHVKQREKLNRERGR